MNQQVSSGPEVTEDSMSTGRAIICACGRFELVDRPHGFVCAGCSGYPDRCLCNPDDFRRVMVMLRVVEPRRTDRGGQ